MKPWAIAVLVLAAVLTETALARPSEADGNEDGYQEDQEADGDDRDAPGPAAPPVLKSTSLNLTPQPGETITLPCVVENAPTVVWLNGSATLAVGANRLTYKDDDRLMFNQDHSMTIKNIRASDSNKYECKIGNSLSVVHTVKVYEPPRILRTDPAGSVILEKGEHVTLNCSAVGFPEPRVSWTRKGRELPGHKAEHAGDHLHYSHVDLRHTGTYVCRAVNALGADERAVYVGVRDGPDVTSVNMVNTKLGATAEVVCVVHAHPPAVVEWHFGKHVLQPGADGRVELVRDRQHEMDGLGQRHVVRLTGVTADDLGTYFCVAKNEQGTARKAIKLSGLPTPAKLEHVDYVQGRPVLHWTVESQEPVTKYEMMYRKTDPISDWTSIELPAEESEGNVHKVKYELDNVEASNYEAKLKSRNSFGWSDMSQKYPFKAESSRHAELSRMKEAGSGAPIERISFGLILGSVAVLLARV